MIARRRSVRLASGSCKSMIVHSSTSSRKPTSCGATPTMTCGCRLTSRRLPIAVALDPNRRAQSPRLIMTAFAPCTASPGTKARPATAGSPRYIEKTRRDREPSVRAPARILR